MSINDVLWPDTPFSLRESMILVGRRGSESHGLYVPPTEPDAIDDRDLVGIVIPPASYYLGLFRWDGAESIKECWDVVLYDIKKYVSLLCAQNPNILCSLWLDQSDYLLVSPLGFRLVENRKLFRVRSAAYKSFVGYASGQLKRMTSFGEFRGYMGAKRKKLVEKHGFDTKNAAHLLRILHMGVEYLETGQLNVRRTWDHDELLAVKRGEVPLVDVQQRAELWFAKCHEAYEKSPLPLELDREAIDRLLVGIMRDALGV